MELVRISCLNCIDPGALAPRVAIGPQRMSLVALNGTAAAAASPSRTAAGDDKFHVARYLLRATRGQTDESRASRQS